MATINGTSQSDILNGTPESDLVYSWAGNDILNGDGGDDFILGYQGDDSIIGGAGDDFIGGDEGSDRLDGNDGDDILYAGAGNDTLRGGNGSDRLFAEAGNDILHLGPGADLAFGGAGADIFVIDSGLGVASPEMAPTIADFNSGEDAIEIIITIAATGGNLEELQNNSNPGNGQPLVNILQGSGDLAGDVLIQNRVTGLFLAVVKNETPPTPGSGTFDPGLTPNNAPENIILSNASIGENSANGLAIGSFSTRDADAGDTHSYSLIDDAAGRFAIASNQLIVANGSLLDFETATSHNITVRTTDSEGLSFDKVFAINVTDVREGFVNSNPTDIAISGSAIAENSPNGTAIVSFSSRDADAGDSHSYSLVDDAAGRFAISGNRLTVANEALLDFETATSHNITVRATDAGGLTLDRLFTISVLNANEQLTDIGLSNTRVNENSFNGTVIGNFTAIDPDIGDTHTYILNNDASGRVAISGNQLTVANGALLDFETETSHNIAVRAIDAGGFAFDKVFTISITNVNEGTTDIGLSNTSVNENSFNGTVVGDLTTSDPDVGDTHFYTLDNDAGGRFAIVGERLVVANGGLLDFEANSSHDITIRTTDLGGLTFVKNFTIVVNNLNETPNLSNDTITGNGSQPLLGTSGDDNIVYPGFAPVTTTAANLLANDSDPDGDSLSIAGVSNPVGGTVRQPDAANNIVFIPDASFTGQGSFQYVASDPGGATSTGTVTAIATPQAPPSIDGSSGQDTLTLTTQATIILSNTADQSAGDSITVSNFENVVGSTNDDSIVGDSNPNFIDGSQGNDVLNGGGSSDTLNGGDTLIGGAGADIISATGFNEYLSGGDGNDTLSLHTFGTTPYPVFRGNSTLLGGEGNDSLFALSVISPSWLNGGAGNDILVSGSSSDTLIGGAGNDFFVGSEGADTLGITPEVGGAARSGSDTLYGFKGADSLIGIVGTFDGFYYTAPAEGNDMITSFDGGMDRFYLNSVNFANLASPGSPLQVSNPVEFFVVPGGQDYTDANNNGTFVGGTSAAAIVFDSFLSGGGVLYLDPSGGNNSTPGTADLSVIATIATGTVNVTDIIVF